MNIVEFIIQSIDSNPNNQSLGEEIRCLKEQLFKEYITTGEPLYEFLFALIQLTPNDYELGTKLRRIKQKVESYYD